MKKHFTMTGNNAQAKVSTMIFMGLIMQFNVGFAQQTYPIVGTNQSKSFDNTTIITIPSIGADYFGQNANYPGTPPSYTNNGDGTVTDNITGLMWQNTLDHNGDGKINVSDKLTYSAVLALPNTCKTGGYTDWRVPTIKEQYSLMAFSGKDISGQESLTADMIPFINTSYFGYGYGDTGAGERLIDVQCASTNVFVGNSTTQMVFGVNFADGRIKGYGTTMMGQAKKFNYLLVRGNTSYGKNSFSNNGDGTITDAATGLMWMQDDSKSGMIWKNALSYAENFTYAGNSDWRLPNAKELQSIVDYTRSPQTSSSAAIDPLFNCTQITNEAKQVDYPFYWCSTTHESMASGKEGGWGIYVAFGRAMGSNNTTTWVDVHGAGAQRSDPKDGDASVYSAGHGPQGDAVRILNYVRLVRNVSTTTGINSNQSSILKLDIYPNPAGNLLNASLGKDNATSGMLKIFDINGKVVYAVLLKAQNEIRIDLTHFNPGIYNVSIETEKGIFGNRFVKL